MAWVTSTLFPVTMMGCGRPKGVLEDIMKGSKEFPGGRVSGVAEKGRESPTI